MIDINSITLKNNAMFNIVMRRPHLCKRCLEMILNTKGKINDIPKPLKNFLDYIDNGTISDDYTRELEKAVVETRKNKRWRKRIMTVEQLIKDEAKLAEKNGYDKGKTEGKAEERIIINNLNSLLLKDNRQEDLIKSLSDPEFQNQLLKEYGLI